MILPWENKQIGNGPVIKSSLTDAETDKLRELAHGGKVLEIGSAYGWSAINMAQAGAHFVLSVDPHGTYGPSLPESLDTMTRNVRNYGMEDKVGMLLAPSRVAMPMLQVAGAKFDLVFVDGDHMRETVHHDFVWGLELLAPMGTVAMHDYGEETCPDVKSVLDAVKLVPRTALVDTLAIYEVE